MLCNSEAFMAGRRHLAVSFDVIQFHSSWRCSIGVSVQCSISINAPIVAGYNWRIDSHLNLLILQLDGNMMGNRKQEIAATGSNGVNSGSSGRFMRPHSTPATLLWLEENYEIAQGVCVPRNTLYVHYVDFCSKHAMTPVNAASFGKVCRALRFIVSLIFFWLDLR